LDLHGRKSLGA